MLVESVESGIGTTFSGNRDTRVCISTFSWDYNWGTWRGNTTSAKVFNNNRYNK